MASKIVKCEAHCCCSCFDKKSSNSKTEILWGSHENHRKCLCLFQHPKPTRERTHPNLFSGEDFLGKGTRV